MALLRKKKPNRAVYKSALWRSIHPIDRAHILLVAEGLKPCAYCGLTDLKSIKDHLSTNLGILITEARGRRRHWLTEIGVQLPDRTYTVCASEKLLRDLLALNLIGSRLRGMELEGKLLGYPRCCRKEYVKPTYRKKYNDRIIVLLWKTCTFKIEAVRRLLEGKEIPHDFMYLMPTQTPCSITCRPSLRLLSHWKKALERYDPEAAAALVEHNRRNRLAQYQTKVKLLKKIKITSEQFDLGYVLH